MQKAENLKDKINWDKGGGLIPAIVQDEKTSQVLMLGYMNREALEKTLSSGLVSFYSRTRQRLWTKGETSSNTLELVDLYLDCDQDTLLILSRPQGPTCHLGTRSCFSTEPAEFITELESIIEQRKKADPDSSYTASLFSEGVSKMAQKLGEEAVEAALAAATHADNFLDESADLLFHFLVLLSSKGYRFQDVEQTLKKRHKPEKS